MKSWSILKKCQTKTKPVVRGYVYYVYYGWWQKEIVATLLYKYTKIRCTCVAWRFGRMELDKGRPAAVDEPAISLLKICSRNEG